MSETRIFGIRHHGPGSARALRDALESFKPDVLLIEGPPEADALVGLAAEPGMVPPVALLAYVPGNATTTAGTGTEGQRDGDGEDAGNPSARRAAFWPFAEFSPEWQAIRHGVATGIPVRFCDLPAAHQLAAGNRTGSVPETETETADEDTPQSVPETGAEDVRLDPLGWLARAAGYDDAERWWDDVVEHRYADGAGRDSAHRSPFEAIAEAMTALREHAPETPAAHAEREEHREAYMRRTLRRTLKEGYERVAVVCGAWHVPAIAAATGTTAAAAGPVVRTAAQDDRTLRGLPKAKVAVTWVPWTHGRLAAWSGYGAGVRSPGWYHHLFTVRGRPIERWLTEAARVLREEDLPVSSAHVIEAVRLAEALATLRDRPLAGLDEVTEATRAVLCEGAELPLELIQRRMVVGERLGSVPENTPMVPLQRDLQAEQRRLRMRPAALETERDLDLRKPNDLDRSRLLHRLRLLGIEWGVPGGRTGRASKGTFRETWTLAWRPELDVELIEAGGWGTTVAEAADARARATAAEAAGLPELTALLEQCLLADLPRALSEVMRSLADRAAADTDVAHLMAALPALARSLRYGDVRGTSTGSLETVVGGLVVRICVGLPPALSQLDDGAARDLLRHIDEVHGALALLSPAAPAAKGSGPAPDPGSGSGSGSGSDPGSGAAGPHLTRWYDTLATVIGQPHDRHRHSADDRGAADADAAGADPDPSAGRDEPAGADVPTGVPGLHGLIEGRLTRLLLDAGRLGDAPRSGVSDRMARAVSVGQPPARAAAWIEGFLSGGGLLLVHDETLLRLVDQWIARLPAEAFTEALPLLRRTFSGYETPERRAIGERVRRLDGTGPAGPGGADRAGGVTGDPAGRERIDTERAAAAERTVRRILGWEVAP